MATAEDRILPGPAYFGVWISEEPFSHIVLDGPPDLLLLGREVWKSPGKHLGPFFACTNFLAPA